MYIPDLDNKDLKHESPRIGLLDLWEDKVKQLEKRYNEDIVLKNLRQQRIDIIEKATPISINYDYSYIYDQDTQQQLNYLEKVFNDYIMEKYINLLERMSYDTSK
ncbi:MAG: hypothetical protein KH100_15785 [Dysgonomonas mossii]|uniref:hypothetical protein n=1 Tax=Dysgonomonas mossii TaxID=163665 RepID=UPI001DA5C8D2|nr:hypothetical protein [Dysgonomonas mossii]MBS5798107.1 hypothetical protein [Dysgonomonas mossii]MBS7112644.1 hypothetical protein [Dysgonomonas mossii]